MAWLVSPDGADMKSLHDLAYLATSETDSVFREAVDTSGCAFKFAATRRFRRAWTRTREAYDAQQASQKKRKR